jgi:hypothetical protein
VENLDSLHEITDVVSNHNQEEQKFIAVEKATNKETMIGSSGEIISAQKNPDVSAFTNELTELVDAELIGTWKGSLDDTITDDTVYWRFELKENGQYVFYNGDTGIEQHGNYTTAHDPNNNYYHSTLILDHGTEKEKMLRFYFSGGNPWHMKTEESAFPVFIKEKS